ncbi:MAG: MFS transporter [Bacteroidales bacterium]|nr:MFS transporter [Bacteroidales bacterium]
MSIFKKFPRTFWVANTVELFERWGWYGLFNVLAIYLTASTDTGALGFTQVQKGMLMGSISAIVYFLPVFTGAFSDKFGYKRSLLIAFVLYFVGFFLMGKMNTFGAVFFSFGIVGIGAAIFKPIVSATISKTTTEKTAILGFGIFYMMVNLGALIGPVISSKLRDVNWDYVFYSSMIAVVLNFLLVLFFFKEPEREKNTDKLWETVKKIAVNIWTAVSDWKFLIFLVIIAGFWTMYMQLFFTLPVFVEQWVDTSILFNAVNSFWPGFANFLGNGHGEINPEMLLNMDAMFIVLFQIIISSIVTKMKPVNAMIGGFFIAAIGLGLMFLFKNPIYIMISILIFAIGEMTGSPTITAYIGLIASKDKKALYMGMSFLPVAVGNFLGGYISGSVYGKMSDKLNLLQKEFINRGWDVPEITKTFTKNDFFSLAEQKLNMSSQQITDFLWNSYQPYHIWYVFTGIGMLTVVALFAYDKLILKSKKNEQKQS